jgi:hypothetical protein
VTAYGATAHNQSTTPEEMRNFSVLVPSSLIRKLPLPYQLASASV